VRALLGSILRSGIAFPFTFMATATLADDGAVGCAAAIAYSDAHRGEAVLVLRDGVSVCQSEDTASAHELWSGTKSFVGIMAAAAVQDKLLTLDEPAADTLTEWQSDPVKKTVTVRHLLSMTSGQPSTIGRPEGYRESLAVALTAKPGERFQYGPSQLQIFGELLRRKLKAAGRNENPREYLERRILKPLGIRVAHWRNGQDGLPLMPQGMLLSASEWAKFGEFVRGGGKIGGRAAVDATAFAQLFRGSTANPAYGLTWWLPAAPKVPDFVTASTDVGRNAADLPSDLVYAAGFGDQRLFIIPSLRLTIVRQASLDLASLRPGATRSKPGWSDFQFLKLLLAREISD